MAIQTPFAMMVYRVVSQIPRGETRTYGQVAAAAGRPGAARAVGTIMSRNTDTERVPCHRVVRADGKVGDYAFGGSVKKLWLLKREGVTGLAITRKNPSPARQSQIGSSVPTSGRRP